MYGARSLPASRARSGRPHVEAMALAAMLFPQPWTPSSRIPLGGSSGRSPASGRNPTRRVAIHFLSFPRPPSCSSPSGAGMNSRSPPPSTRPFFVSRMRGRSATDRALSSTIARARARSASKTVRPCRSVTMPSASARVSETRTVGFSRVVRRMTFWRRSRSSSGPGRANSSRTWRSSSSGFDGIEGPTRTSVRDDPAKSCAVSRSSRSVAAASRCGIGSLSSQVPSPVLAGSVAAPRRGRSISPRRSGGPARGRSRRSSSRTGSSIRPTRRARGPRIAAPRSSRRRRAGGAIAAGGRGPWR